MKDPDLYMIGILQSHLEKPDFTMEKVWPLIQYSPLKKTHLRDFCQEVLRKIPDSVITAAPLSRPKPDEIVSEKIENKTPRPSWKDWPEDVKKEIKYVLEQNDSGRRKVSMSDYIKRMREDFHLDVSDHGVKAFCKSLGRRGWTK